MSITTRSFKLSVRTFISRTAPLLTLVGLFGLSGVLPAQPAQAAVGINSSINYQGRLLNAAGAVVADGTYNMQFKIYQDGPGNVANDTGGTLMWTESWVYGVNTPDNRVTVKNGYFSVNLGTICAFTSTTCTANTGNAQTNTVVDFNQDTLWLSTNIENTAGVTAQCTGFASGSPASCTGGDGEMLPMRRMASAVYALQAKTCTTCVLQGPTATATNTISPTGSTTGLTVNGSSTATLAVNVLQSQAADAVNIALSGAGTKTNGLSVTNATGTTTNGLSVIGGATGTVTNGLQLTSTGGGTFTTGINFTGTFGNLIVAPNFGLSNAGVITLAGAQTADITTLAGTTPTALVFQPGNNTTATSTGAAFTLQAGNDSGATTATGGLLTLKGGNATGGSQTGGGVTIDSGTGTTGGLINVGAANAATIQIANSALGSGTQAINIGNSNTAGGTQNITIGTGTTASAGFTTVRAKGALTLTGGSASTWDLGGTTLSLQTGGNGAITTGTGLLTQGGSVTFSGTTARTITGPTTGGLTINDTGGALTVSTTTSGTLAVSSAGALNLTGAAASTLNVGANTLAVTSSDFNVTSGGAVTAISTIQGTQFTSTISTGTAPLVVTSTTVVTNLNADMVDGLHAASFQAAGNYLIQAPSSTATNTITPTGATTGLTVNGSATATLAVNVVQGQAADGVNIALSAAGTNANGLLVSRAAAGTTTNGLSVTNATGTTTNGLQLTQSSGTFTTGINFTGTFGNLIVAPNFSVSNAGVITLAGAQTADITTAAGTTPTALIFQPGNNTTASATGAAFTLKAGNESGTTTAVGGTLTLQGGNATAVSGTRTGGNVVIDAGTGATANGAISIGTTNVGTITLGNTTGATAVNINAGTGNLNLSTNSASASIIAKTSTNSATGFVVQNTSSAAVLTVDTSGGNVIIGSGSTGQTTPKLLVVDNKTGSSTDPTGVNGAIYYNVTLNAFRCYANGAWEDCVGVNADNQRLHPFWSTDFLTTSNALPWAVNKIGNGPGNFTAPNPGVDHPGVVEWRSTIACTTNPCGYSSTNLGSAGSNGYTGVTIGGGENFEAVFNAQTLDANTQTYAGLIDEDDGSAPANGIYISISNTTLSGVSASSSTRTSTGTTTTITANTWYRLKIVVNSSATSVTYYLYDAAGTTQLWTDTVSANIPTATGSGITSTYATHTGTNVLLWLDYMAMWYTTRSLSR